LKRSSKLNMPTRFIAELLSRQICLASDLCTIALQVAFRIPIKCDDEMIGHWQSQTGFKLSAEDLPVRLSATTS
jgi:hypothetical protein